MTQKDKKTKDEDQLRIGVDLNLEASRKFEEVKKSLGIEASADVVRFLINWYYDKLQSKSV